MHPRQFKLTVLKALDPQGRLGGVAYSKVFNTRLGVGGPESPSSMTVFLPWGAWLPNFPTPPTRSLLAAAFNTFFHLKRVLSDNSHNLHAKTACVDRRMLYIGSDNAYLEYNEQHGCWVEAKPQVDAWMSDFFEGLWARSTVRD
jgi:phosphatidylserine/phosphatidylglycerophosphate/cardiolipin synthase-like enzyme